MLELVLSGLTLKALQAQYQDGSITQWLIIKSCGECAYSIYVSVPSLNFLGCFFTS